MAEEYSIVYVYHIFIHFSADGHLGCFHVMAILNSVAINIGVHVCFWIVVFSRYMPRSGIAGSHGCSILFFIVVNKVYSNKKKKSLMKEKKRESEGQILFFVVNKEAYFVESEPGACWVFIFSASQAVGLS